MLRVLVPREVDAGETRVAATPESVERMVKEGLAVSVETGAGVQASLADDKFQNAGASMVQDLRVEWVAADLVLKVAPLTSNPRLGGEEAALLKPGAVVVGFMAPHKNEAMVRTLVDRRVTALAMELVPRITRAQKWTLCRRKPASPATKR